MRPCRPRDGTIRTIWRDPYKMALLTWITIFTLITPAVALTGLLLDERLARSL
jgi:hypothetical protein